MLSVTADQFARAIIERHHDFPELRDVYSEKSRKRRSERLEAIGLVFKALMVRTDLLSLVVRYEGEGLPKATIAKWTGLSERRIGRALFDMRWAAIASGPGKFGPNRIPQPVETYDPRICRGEACPSCATGADHVCHRANCVACARGLPHLRGKAAIRQLSLLAFEKVGTDGWLKEQQALAWAELQKRQAPAPMSELALGMARRAVEAQVRVLAASERVMQQLAKREPRPPD